MLTVVLMPNQRKIASVLGISQTAVSMALRGDPSIPLATRRRVEATAKELGYRPNPLVSTLMEHIRTGREVRDQGCIAILVDAASEADWLRLETYRLQFEGYRRWARLRGYVTECFYLRAPSSSPARIDRQLRARGITGLILAAPYDRERPPVQMTWEHYACATVSYTWDVPQIGRVSSHHRHNVDSVFSQLRTRGYRRIGMCLPDTTGNDSNWLAGYFIWHQRLSPPERVPLFVGTPQTVPISKFTAWLERWRPDVIIGLVGHEMQWLKELGLSPSDLPLACLNRPPNSDFAGVEENNIIVGEMACDLVVNQIIHNERGLSAHPRLLLIEGTWHEGVTLPARKPRKSAARGVRLYTP